MLYNTIFGTLRKRTGLKIKTGHMVLNTFLQCQKSKISSPSIRFHKGTGITSPRVSHQGPRRLRNGPLNKLSRWVWITQFSGPLPRVVRHKVVTSWITNTTYDFELYKTGLLIQYVSHVEVLKNLELYGFLVTPRTILCLSLSQPDLTPTLRRKAHSRVQYVYDHKISSAKLIVSVVLLKQNSRQMTFPRVSRRQINLYRRTSELLQTIPIYLPLSLYV